MYHTHNIAKSIIDEVSFDYRAAASAFNNTYTYALDLVIGLESSAVVNAVAVAIIII